MPQLETTQAEQISVEHVAKATPTDGISSSERNEPYTAKSVEIPYNDSRTTEGRHVVDRLSFLHLEQIPLKSKLCFVFAWQFLKLYRFVTTAT